MSSPPSRVDWQAVRDAIDMAELATRLLGPAPGRRGERGRKLWWSCPLGGHEDGNPSFAVEPGKPWWKCWGCGKSGDAVALVMKLNGWTFPEAAAYLAGGEAPPSRSRLRPRSVPRPPAGPSGMPTADALALVAEAERRLWTPEGADALDYLRGRGLTEETIRTSRLGVVQPLDLPGRPRGVLMPWLDGDRLALAKLRQPEGMRPKYRELFRDSPTLYPGRRVIRPGLPLIVAEGELDALLLGQELEGLAPVVTLGSASARPEAAILGHMLGAHPWLIATDNDPAGDKAASGWPAVARRVRPPGAFKDWTEAFQAGVGLRRWWVAVLAGDESPPLFTWEELAAQRWGPATDEDPNIIIEPPTSPEDRPAVELLGHLPESLPFHKDAYRVAKSVVAMEKALDGEVATAWNCEPTPEHIRSVQEMIDAASRQENQQCG